MALQVKIKVWSFCKGLFTHVHCSKNTQLKTLQKVTIWKVKNHLLMVFFGVSLYAQACYCSFGNDRPPMLMIWVNSSSSASATPSLMDGPQPYAANDFQRELMPVQPLSVLFDRSAMSYNAFISWCTLLSKHANNV